MATNIKAISTGVGYTGYTLPIMVLYSGWDTSSNSPWSSYASFPLLFANSISFTISLCNYNDMRAYYFKSDSTTVLAYSHTGRGGYTGTFTDSSLGAKYSSIQIVITGNGNAANPATITGFKVTV